MDFNKSGERAIKLNTCENKFNAFGWDSYSVVDGNDEKEIKNNIDKAIQSNKSKPIFIQLNTIKGKGCLPMENNPEWHHKHPTSDSETNELVKTLY
jgi:transketolase